MNISHDHLDDALLALRHDSQKGIFGNMGNAKIHISKETFDKCDFWMKKYNSPLRIDMTMDELRKLVY